MHGLEDLQKIHTHSNSLLVLCAQWCVGEVSSRGHGIAKAAVIQNSKPTKYTDLFLRYLYNLTEYSDMFQSARVSSSGNQTKVNQHKTKLVAFVRS